MKKCYKCKLRRRTSSFYKRARSTDGKSRVCKDCEKLYKLKFYKENRIRLLSEKKKQYRLGDTKNRILIRQRERIYGVSDILFKKILSRQRNRCAICRVKNPNSLDHNHINKSVRGILCIRCNFGLGHFKDKIKILKAAIKYLRSTRNAEI